MEENRVYKEGEMSEVTKTIEIKNKVMNSECNDLPDTNVVVQCWLNTHDVDELPTLPIKSMNETLVKEVECNKNSNNFLPTLEGSGNSDASGFSDMTELDHGDPEILVTRVKIAPSADSIAGENSECDREYFDIKRYENMEKQLQKLTNKEIVNELERQNQNKILLEIQNQNNNNMDSIRDAIQQVVAQVGGSVSASLEQVLSAQNDLKGNMNKIQNEVTEIKSDGQLSQNKIQDNFTQLENRIQGDLAQAEINTKIQIDKLSCQGQGLATKVIAAITNVEGRIQFLGQELGTVREEVGFLSEKIKQYEGDTNKELQAQGSELAHMRDRIDFLEKELEEARIEVQAHASGNGILVSGLESQVSTLKRTIEEVEGLYRECQQGIDNLEEKVEAGATRGNVLNNHLQEIDSKLDRVNELPERMEHTLVQLLKNYKKEFDTNNFSKYPVPPECPTQPMNPNKLVTPILPIPNNIPSIPSSPILNNSFLTPQFFVNQPIPESSGALPKNRNMRSDQVIADIVKREQKPCFNGDNVSPPIFLQEVERFFELIQITDDRDRLQLFPTFLITNPFEWWKLISYQVTTWDMAKDLFLKQYFNDYERQRYKAEWHSLDCKDFSNVEEFTLRGLKILSTIKTNDSEQKKCERITVKLPEPLRDYLLNKQFQSTQHFLSCIKEAMLLKNFNPSLYFKKQKSSSSASTGNFQSSNNGGNNTANPQTNGNSNNGNNHNRNYYNRNNGYNNNSYINNNSNIPNINPHFKGNPNNYIPNFKPPSNGHRNNGNRDSSFHPNSGYRSPPKSPPRGQNRNNYSDNRSNGQGNQYNNRNSTYYKNSRFSYNRNHNNGNAGTSGATTPRPGVNQVRRAATPPTPGSPRRTNPPTTTNQAPTSPVTHLHFTFPTHLLRTEGADMLSPQASPTQHFTMKGNFVEEMDERTEN